MKTFHFFVGLPRSGGTLLSSILNQNPDVHVASTTAMFEVLKSVDETWHKTPTMIAHPIPEQLKNITKAVIDSMWVHRSEPIIIDRNRVWGHNMPFAQKVFDKDIKVFTTIRDLPSAMVSWATLYKNENPNIDQPTLERNVTEMWKNFVEPSTKSIIELKKHSDILLIDYDDLVTDTVEQLSRIETFLDLPKHTYDLENIKGDFQEKNIVPYGPKNMHYIRARVEKISAPAEQELGSKLFEHFKNLDEKFKSELHHGNH
jgi:hypothetical protein